MESCKRSDLNYLNTDIHFCFIFIFCIKAILFISFLVFTITVYYFDCVNFRTIENVYYYKRPIILSYLYVCMFCFI